MGLFNYLFSGNKENEVKSQLSCNDDISYDRTEQIAVPLNSQFDLDLFRTAAAAEYKRQMTGMMATAAYEIAKLIDGAFDTQQVRCMVPASELDAYAGQEAFPIHFLFSKDGVPRVAVVVVTTGGCNTPRVLATKVVCEQSGVAYLRVYANGTYADWITDRHCDAETVEFCKTHIVERINDLLWNQPLFVPSNSRFDISRFHLMAMRNNAVYEVAKLIDTHFDIRNVRCMVEVADLDPSYSGQDAFPIHFLLYNDGKPKVAVAVVTEEEYDSPRVLEANNICEGAGVTFLRVHVDWLTADSDDNSTVESRKARVVKHINNYLQ